MVPGSSTTPTGKVRHKCRLHVELEVGVGDGCVFHGTAVDPDSVSVFVMDSTCNCRYTTVSDAGSADTYNVTESIDEDCVCGTFCANGCVPTIESVDDDTFVVSTYVPDRTVLADLIAGLKAVTTRVRLLRIVEETGGPDGNRSVSFDLTVLTRTQRETLEVAVTRGYYDDDGCSLDDLAEELDVSKSALSRRLSRAEAKLVSELIPSE